jgi:hypothetical protein
VEFLTHYAHLSVKACAAARGLGAAKPTRHGRIVMTAIHSLLVTSTAHATVEEAQALTHHGYSRGAYGWFFYVGEYEDPVLAEIEPLSDGLVGVIRQARECGCQYVLLNRDADTIPNAPTYQW